MRLSINDPRVNALKPTLRREVTLCGSVAAAARKLSLILADHYYPYSMPEDAPKNLWRRRGRLFQTIITPRLLYSILRPRVQPTPRIPAVDTPAQLPPSSPL